MKITIISGSSRKQSQSIKVANFMKALLENKEVEASVLDLQELNLPPYDPDNTDVDGVDELKKTLEASDGFVLISPEWNGMMNHRIISFFHYIGLSMADKPVMLAGVSSSYHGGHYPVEQMRILGVKNKHFVVIPEHLVIKDVKNVMNSTILDDGNESDVYIKKRAYYALKTLIEYSKALKSVRVSGVVDYDTYPNGM